MRMSTSVASPLSLFHSAQREEQRQKEGAENMTQDLQQKGGQKQYKQDREYLKPTNKHQT
jgi:hypothetical protein